MYELGIGNSYTLEASFCGPDKGPRKNTQFSTIDLEHMGAQWCESLITYFKLKKSVSDQEKILIAEKSRPDDDLIVECESTVSVIDLASIAMNFNHFSYLIYSRETMAKIL